MTRVRHSIGALIVKVWGLVPVHLTELDSSEKVLMSRGLAED